MIFCSACLSATRTSDASAAVKIASGSRPAWSGDDVADLGDPPAYRDPEGTKQALGDAADGDPRGGLARARALEDVPDVVVVVLEDAGEVGMARTRPGDGDLRVAILGTRRHLLGPVLPVAVLDDERDRRAQRLSEAHTGPQLRRVLLDFHAAAAPVAHHAAPHVDVHRVDVDREPRRTTFENGCEARTM